MAIKKQLPLKGINNVPKSCIHTHEGFNYAALLLNIGSKDGLFDFNESIIPFHVMTATGWSDGTNTWFLATVPKDENGKLFSLEIKPDWKTVDNVQTKEAVDLWEKTGCLIAIDTANLPNLKVLALCLHENKWFIKGDLKIKVAASDVGEDVLKSQCKNFFEFFRENKRFANSKKGEDVSAVSSVVGALGIPYLLFDEPGFGLPEIEEMDEITGLPTGEKTTQSVPFDGDFPNIEKVIFNPPTIATNGTKKGGWSSGSTVNVEGFKSESAWEFVQKNAESISSFFNEGFDLTGSDLALCVLSLAGVPSLPNFQKPKFDAPLNIPPIKVVEVPKEEITSLNGHAEHPKELDQIPGNIPETSDFIKEKLREQMKTDEKKGGLKLSDEDIDRWFEIHKESPKDPSKLYTILCSNAWRLHRKDVAKYYSKMELGNEMDGLPPTILKSESLSNLHEKVLDFEAHFAIDQTKKFSEFVAS